MKNVYTNPSGGHQGRPNHQGTCEWFPVENRMAFQVRQGTRPEEVLEVLGGRVPALLAKIEIKGNLGK